MKSKRREVIADKVRALKPGESFQVANASELTMAYQEIRARRAYDKTCPDFTIKRGQVVALPKVK